MCEFNRLMTRVDGVTSDGDERTSRVVGKPLGIDKERERNSLEHLEEEEVRAGEKQKRENEVD